MVKAPSYCMDCGFDFDAEKQRCDDCHYCIQECCICRDDSPAIVTPVSEEE
jgi:predicted Zn-ribbon and HTH transcriptional regulator